MARPALPATPPIKVLFEQLGMELAQVGTYHKKDEKRLAMVLMYLRRDLLSLGRLAETNSVTLFQLAENKLLPDDLVRLVKSQVSSRLEECDEWTAVCHKPVGELTDGDHVRFGKIRNAGRASATYVRLLAQIHRDSSGFRTLPWPHNVKLTQPEQEALLDRIKTAVRDDTTLQRKLLAMFPRPA